MLENEFYIAELIGGYFRGELTDEKQQELNLWLNASKGNRNYFDSLSDYETLSQKLKQYDTADKARLWEKTITKVNGLENDTPSAFTKTKIFKLWYKIAIAASIILVSGIVILTHNWGNGYQSLNAKNDVAAGSYKAYITLGGEKKINLSSKECGVVINEKALSYNDGTEITVNTKKGITLATPMGGTYQVTLPDGTKCWLNAASDIQFPSSFANADQRKVTLHGEAYFEVTKDKQHPFIVKSYGQEIKVLGTHFNINSYAGERTKTTLLEGSVQVNNNVIIKPGEQATGSGLGIDVKQADVQADIAWKNGDFIFNNEPLENIMRQVARWYNVDIIYAADAPKNFTMTGVVSRSRPISAVLERMQGTGKVSFKIDGRKIYVSL